MPVMISNYVVLCIGIMYKIVSQKSNRMNI